MNNVSSNGYNAMPAHDSRSQAGQDSAYGTASGAVGGSRYAHTTVAQRNSMHDDFSGQTEWFAESKADAMSGALTADGADVYSDDNESLECSESPSQAFSFAPEHYSFALPEAMQNDAELTTRLTSFCLEKKLSPEQAQAAVSFWQAEEAQAMEQSFSQCEQALRQRWKGEYDVRLGQAQHVLTALDARMGGRLMPLASGSLGNNPIFVEMLSSLADVLQEERFEAGGAGGTRGGGRFGTPLSTEDFLRQMVFKR